MIELMITFLFIAANINLYLIGRHTKNIKALLDRIVVLEDKVKVLS